VKNYPQHGSCGQKTKMNSLARVVDLDNQTLQTVVGENAQSSSYSVIFIRGNSTQEYSTTMIATQVFSLKN
jgi:hypothetical protein